MLLYYFNCLKRSAKYLAKHSFGCIAGANNDITLKTGFEYVLEKTRVPGILSYKRESAANWGEELRGEPLLKLRSPSSSPPQGMDLSFPIAHWEKTRVLATNLLKQQIFMHIEFFFYYMLWIKDCLRYILHQIFLELSKFLDA